jgi:hypothetical protein
MEAGFTLFLSDDKLAKIPRLFVVCCTVAMLTRFTGASTVLLTTGGSFRLRYLFTATLRRLSLRLLGGLVGRCFFAEKSFNQSVFLRAAYTASTIADSSSPVVAVMIEKISPIL